jgi:hypothetical protein
MSNIKETTKTIEVTAYTHNNKPCCAKNFDTGEVCVFYRTQRMGCNETCIFADQSGKYGQLLERRNNGNGTLIPHDNCPVWSKTINDKR